MKKFTITLTLSILSLHIFAQDTLQHFNFDSITPIIETYTSNQGYYTGHNNYGDEECEKYEFIGTTNILELWLFTKDGWKFINEWFI